MKRQTEQRVMYTLTRDEVLAAIIDSRPQTTEGHSPTSARAEDGLVDVDGIDDEVCLTYSFVSDDPQNGQ